MSEAKSTDAPPAYLGRRGTAYLAQFRMDDPSWPRARRMPAPRRRRRGAPAVIDAEATQRGPEPVTYLAPRRVKGDVPFQAVVDRRLPLPATLVDIEVRVPGGPVLQIVRQPPFGPFGSDTGDPGRVPNPFASVCGLLAPYAQSRCAGWHGG